MTLRNFLSRAPRPIEIWAYLVASCTLWLIVLNRWAVTPIGLKSYGRVWQNQISYFELGFIRRGLWGTLLRITGLNSIPGNEYVNAFLIHGLLLALISLMITLYILNNSKKLSNSLAIFVFLSPAFLSFLAYSLGTLDVVVSLFLVYSCLFERNFWRLGIIAIIGILIHESYFFFVPFIAVNNFLMIRKDLPADEAQSSVRTLPTLVLPILAVVALKAFEPTVPSAASFELFMRQKLPNAAYQCPFWSGYFELYSSFSQNTKLFIDGLSYIPGKIGYSTVPILYLVGMLFYVCRSRTILKFKAKAFYVITILGPLAISLVGNDYLRWINLSSILGVLAILTTQAAGVIHGDPVKLARLLPFTLFGPFGRALDYPMPIHQFLLNRLLR